MKGHPWSPAEDLLLVAGYEDGLAPAAIAELLTRPGVRRTVGCVCQRKMKLGLPRQWAPVPKRTLDRLRRLHARGMSDMQMAAALGLDRRLVNSIRHRLGLSCNRDLEAMRRAVRNQLKTLGLKSPTELRTRAFRLYAIENGWPADCRPREVQILNVLAASGTPMTNIEIATAIGMRTDRIQTNGQPAILVGNGPGGTYTASLIRRGLVLALKQAGPQKKTTGKGCGRRKSLYTLGPAALAILQERAKCAQAQTA